MRDVRYNAWISGALFAMAMRGLAEHKWWEFGIGMFLSIGCFWASFPSPTSASSEDKT